jgi:hypothetical protein
VDELSQKLQHKRRELRMRLQRVANGSNGGVLRPRVVAKWLLILPDTCTLGIIGIHD